MIKATESPESRTCMVEGKNWFAQVLRSTVHTQTHTVHTIQNKCIKICKENRMDILCPQKRNGDLLAEVKYLDVIFKNRKLKAIILSHY